MNIFITSTNTNMGKTYITKNLFKLLKEKGYNVCIFKPFQTEEINNGRYPDLDVFKKECLLDYKMTSLYKFSDPVSPHLAFKIEKNQKPDSQKLLHRVKFLENKFDIVLIEGAGGIGVPIYEYDNHFYMTKDLIKETSELIISVLPSKLGAISDAIVHQSYIDKEDLPPNLLIMNNYINDFIENDNKKTIEKETEKVVYTFQKDGIHSDFSEEFIQYLIGGNNE